jgi:hypothetical protein
MMSDPKLTVLRGFEGFGAAGAGDRGVKEFHVPLKRLLMASRLISGEEVEDRESDDTTEWMGDGDDLCVVSPIPGTGEY